MRKNDVLDDTHPAERGRPRVGAEPSAAASRYVPLGYEATARTVRDPARVAAVRETGLLDTEAEEVFDRLTQLAVKLLGVPAAFISLVDADRDFYKSEFGFPEPLASERELTGPTFCHYAIQSTEPLAIADTAAHPIYRDVPTVKSLGVAAYAGVPLVDPDGNVLGSLCAIDMQPHDWSPTEIEVLTELAASARREIELRAAVRKSDELARELRLANARLEADAEEARRNEQQFRTLAESIPQLAWMTDGEGWITWYNQRWYDYTGTTPEEMQGWGWQSVHHRDTLPRVLERWRAALECGTPWEDTFPLRRHDGEFGWFLSRAFPIRDSEGHVVRWFGTNTDITEQRRITEALAATNAELEARTEQLQDTASELEVKAAELQLTTDELQRKTEEAENANRAKSDFLASMSHELRTPLNAIGGYVELLEMGLRGPVTPEQLADLARIQRSQKHLLSLINDVLNFAKLGAGQVEYRTENVLLDAALRDTDSMIMPQIRSRGLEYVYRNCAPELAVRADREKLQQIVLNLLSNSTKFTEQGGSITMDCSASDGDVRISVHDTGVGIPPEKLETVFEPFVQLERKLSQPVMGAGLGLAISRDLARGMGGDLTACSCESGSTFTLTLPRAAV